jgi:hypothetical protein
MFFDCIAYKDVEKLIENILVVHIFSIHLYHIGNKSAISFATHTVILTLLCINAEKCCKETEVAELVSRFPF